jgi:hypothetical protein
MSNVHYLHGRPQPVTRFLRVSEHRRLEELLVADRLPYDRFVLEAGSFKEQKELAQALIQEDCELTLDTNVAELSVLGRFNGVARHAPWAAVGRALTETDLGKRSGAEVVREIARFAVENGFSRVLAPCHYILDADDPWFQIDIENCCALRGALDTLGGQHVELDYTVITSASVLNDAAKRRAIISQLGSLPAGSIWMRISKFGIDATGTAIRKYILSLQDFHSLKRPVVADGVGGAVGLAVTSFGAASSVSFGVAGRERFDASGWNRPPKAGGGGGAYCYLLSGLDRLLKREEAEAIIAAPGGRRLLSCSDRSCCPHGFDDTLKDPKGHFLRQRAKMFESISAVPEAMRVAHFLNHDLKNADRAARQIAKLRIANNALVKRLIGEATRLDRMRPILEGLEGISSIMSRSLGMGRAESRRVQKVRPV